ncbi:hypothetical protein [Mesorhizobium sp. CN2-181]|uniref:hypothetical protein n=1 Tax=Mesorhizobium yinganensis TaxID=3157707 RepID=UPI0032B74F5C
MPYLNDTMRVELSLPVHIMLAVLLSGANCAEPSATPGPEGILEWTKAWERHHQRVASDAKFARDYEIFKQTKDLLLEAMAEPLVGLYPKKKEFSLLRRIERIHHEIIQPYLKTESPDPRKIGIIAFYLLQHLVDTEMLVVPPDCAFGRALEVMLPALSPWEGSTEAEVADYDRLNHSARKQVRKLLHHLQNEGYYLGIPLPDYQEKVAA